MKDALCKMGIKMDLETADGMPGLLGVIGIHVEPRDSQISACNIFTENGSPCLANLWNYV